jgi:hypothetical protein
MFQLLLMLVLSTSATLCVLDWRVKQAFKLRSAVTLRELRALVLTIKTSSIDVGIGPVIPPTPIYL